MSINSKQYFKPLIPSPLEELVDDRLSRHGVRLFLKRDDLIHPDIPGNKWRKLKYNLSAATDQGYKRLLTFGGAYSNHIRAVAAAGYYFGFETIGVIRGEEHLLLNSSLTYAKNRGMTLVYLDRESYRRKTDPTLAIRLHRQFGDFYLVPEGGSNALAVKGCAELPTELGINFDVICCACGTGGTLAGIATGLGPNRRALGFSVLKGGDFLYDDVRRLQQAALVHTTDNWDIRFDYHFGGYAKRNHVLDSFIVDFKARHNIQLEWVYVAKMMYGVFDLTQHGWFAKGTVIIAVITG